MTVQRPVAWTRGTQTSDCEWVDQKIRTVARAHHRVRGPRLPVQSVHGSLGRLLDTAISINVDDETVIIQHPAGRPLSAVVDNTRVVDVGSARFQYEADTLRGSSGAPVFRKNDLGLAGVHVQGGNLDKLSADGVRLTNEGVLATAIASAAL